MEKMLLEQEATSFSVYSSHNAHLGPYSTEAGRVRYTRTQTRTQNLGTNISIINYLFMTARITSCSSLVHSN